MKVGFLMNDVFGRGGVERVTFKLATYFAEILNYDVDIISYFESEDKEIYFKYSSKVNIIYCKNKNEALKSFGKIKRFYELQKNLEEFINDNEYDCIISLYTHFNMKLALARKKIKAKIIGCEHGQYYSTSKKTRILRRIVYKKLDNLVVLTDRDKEIYEKFCKSVITIPNPLVFETDEKSTLMEKRIINVGRLTEEKGVHYLLEAFAKVSNKFPEWTLTFVGNGNYKENLIERAKELEVNGKVEILPFTTEIKDLYLKSSIYAMASETEAFPMTLLEAMELGVPCICFDCRTGPREIVTDGEDGYIIDMYNLEKFSERLENLMENDTIRYEFGINAKKNINRYSKENILEKWKKLLEQG
ncbi:Glycosyltransferase involved in cell wall bisynthesis [Clostridium collagenovorans DSM 3089]|uniref:Glycosyltransferase involved in cell wall bisynthesis n=1 Tax=Clostridium collagenovorans DSM 3089 TaxID=1121306 RepID=A0A1M5YJ66_9CLOT|nr:glycosyltransferase family 4 protein [Clostridium collagenovorans]SHI12070.1 Glycosyltransferase involved in cell wall bisynthesis [Clostridium collagenovorans DSM 3089]